MQTLLKMREDWTREFGDRQRAISPVDVVRRIVFFDRVLYQGMSNPSVGLRCGIVAYGIVYVLGAMGLIEGAVVLLPEVRSDGILSIFPILFLSALGCLMFVLGLGVVRNGITGGDRRKHPLALMKRRTGRLLKQHSKTGP
jgi:hypothetical protein